MRIVYLVLKNLIPFILTIVMTLTYLTSLKSCPSKPSNYIECEEFLFDNIPHWIAESMASATLFLIINAFAFQGCWSKIWIIVTSTIMVSLFIFRHGLSSKDHGLFSIFIFMAWFCIILIFYEMLLLC